MAAKNNNIGELKIKDISNILFESAAEGLIVSDEVGAIRIANPSVEEMFGYEKKELIGQKIEILIPEKYRKRHVGFSKEYNVHPSKRSMGIGMDLSGQRKDGSIFPVEISLNHFKVGRDKMVIALVSDITQRKKIQEELEAEKERYLGTLDNMIEGCQIIGFDWRYIYLNDAAARHGRRKKEELLSKTMMEMNPGIEKTEVFSCFKKCMKQRIPQHMENLFTYPEGGKAWFELMIQPVEAGIFILSLDITEKKKAEETMSRIHRDLEQKVAERTQALQDSQQLYKSIARNFPNGVINVLDKEFNYVFVEGMEMFKRGITGEMLIGTSFLKRVDKIIRNDIKKKLQAVLRGENFNTEMKSEEKTYMVNATGLRGQDNKIIHVLLVTQNITSLKKAEESTQQSLENEQHLNELKSRFVSMASHEFRTPLTSVLNSVSLLSKYIGVTDQEEKQKRHTERIKSSVHHLISILNDFLSLDKLEEGKVKMHYSEFDLPEFSKEIVKEIQDIAKNGQKISYRHKGKSDVYLDKQMLKNIFNNLLSNAIKYSPDDSIVKFETAIENGSMTAFVKDQGMGIPEEEQHHLFDRFFRAKNAMNIQGTGLGLNIVKKYLEMAGGDISFESKSGMGTTFKVQLPANMNLEDRR